MVILCYQNCPIREGNQWETAYNSGIDNVRFSIVPLPGAAGLLVLGLLMLFLARRRSAA